MGQKAKYSLGANDVRSGPDNGHTATAAACPVRAKRRHDGLNQVLRSLIQVCFPRPFSLRDICRKDCSEGAGRSPFYSPPPRRAPPTPTPASPPPLPPL